MKLLMCNICCIYVVNKMYDDDDAYPEKTIMDIIIEALDANDDKETIIGYINGDVNVCGDVDVNINYTELLKYACKVNNKAIIRYLLEKL
jgi:hypothetical protein